MTASHVVQKILNALDKVRKTGNGWSARCPAHDDRKSSLSVAKGEDGRALLRCFAGCGVADIVAALGLEVHDLFPFPRYRRTAGRPRPGAGGLRLKEYAKAKQLPLNFLRRLGVGTISLQGRKAVRMPYIDEAGNVPATRMRLSLGGDTRFIWKVGSKPILYGLWRLKKRRRRKYIVLVEGESDCHTLWSHRFPALGLPGAASWQERWADALDGFKRVYVVVEPDKGGEAVLRWLATSKIRDRARIITLRKEKDPSLLYLRDPEHFTANWKRSMGEAIPWSRIKKQADRVAVESAWRKCNQLAAKEDLLSEFVRALHKRGAAGETRVAKLLYLIVTSRLLEKPVSCVLAGPSSVGKSFVAEAVLAFFPSTAFYSLTAMSEKALAFSAEPLKHRFLVLYEGAALNSEFLNYVLRSLLSEGRVRYETVEKTPAGLKARLIEREGPTGLLMTTTAVGLHPENETRVLTVPISDSPTQTSRVLRALANVAVNGSNHHTSAVQLEEWHVLQEWLKLAEHRVVIPYANTLADLVPAVAVRLRRDFSAILNLIAAHAILHQANRRKNPDGVIVARLADYRAVRRLVNDIVSEGAGRTVSDTVRQTVKVVRGICKEGGLAVHNSIGPESSATMKQIADKLCLDRSAAYRRVKKCVQGGYLHNLECKPGKTFRYVVGDQLPEDKRLLPTSKTLRIKWHNR